MLNKINQNDSHHNERNQSGTWIRRLEWVRFNYVECEDIELKVPALEHCEWNFS